MSTSRRPELLVGGHRTAARATAAAPVVGSAALDPAPAASVAPQGDAEGDERDALGDGHRPVERLRQHRERGGRDGADGEQGGRPAGEDAGAEQRDAEDETAEQVDQPR